ncbi:MAG TPA: trypsin-like peptidase domain-containing protein [Planctomycetota bacterium]|nr:trypsin-like peptidase domain-containing protein [Planctomycetota bacterium]
MAELRNRSCVLRARMYPVPALFALALLPFAVQAAESPDPDPDIELAVRLERGFAKLAQRVAPAVVSLSVSIKRGNWMEELRRMGEQMNLPPEPQFEGSGVIVDPAGYIVTNEHVVRSAERIRVKLADGRVFNAELCGSDARSDLAMIKLSGEDIPADLPTAALADSDKVAVGQWAVAVGNPFGLSNTLTVGVVSARGRSMPSNNFSNDVFYGNLIQTDAAINPGNSGGPLFDMRGKLIGINTMIFSKTGISQGFGFAIPSNHLQKRLAYLKSGREIEYGWLGVRLGDLRPGQKEFKVPENKGVLIEGVIPNTPADRAGMEQGMVILDFDGARIANSQELMGAVNETPVGRTVKVKVLDRLGRLADLNVRISKRYSEVVRASTLGIVREGGDIDLEEDVAGAEKGIGAKGKNVYSWRGMQVRELSADEGKKRGGRIEVIRVKKSSSADRAGLYEGAILTELKHAGITAIQKFTTLEEFKRTTTAVSGAAAVYTPLDGYVTVEDR